MKKNSLIVLVALIVVVVNVIIFVSVYQKSLAPSDSSASTNVKTVLTLVSPASVSNVPAGTNISVGLSMQNTTSDTVSEIVLNFDPNVLSIATTGISESANILAVNKTTNNTTGKVTIDIANSGAGDLPANTTLVTFTFTTRNATTVQTVIATDPITTIGVPNQLVTSGLGSLTLKFIPTRCGDNLTQTPNDAGFTEQCDQGTNNGVACTAAYGGTCSYCTTSCTLQTVQGPRCGDNTKQTQEQCDQGANNGTVCTATYGNSCSYCNTSCQTVSVLGPRCGDSIPQTANGEQCDQGASNGTVCSPTYGASCNYCNSSCQTVSLAGAKCGDGVIQTASGEVCDDSNTAALDSCSINCKKSCAAGTVAKNNSCVPIACRADYDDATDSTETIGIADFSVFAQNYKKAGIACSLDIFQTSGVCFIDIQDLALFAASYKVNNVCLAP